MSDYKRLFFDLEILRRESKKMETLVQDMEIFCKKLNKFFDSFECSTDWKSVAKLQFADKYQASINSILTERKNFLEFESDMIKATVRKYEKFEIEVEKALLQEDINTIAERHGQKYVQNTYETIREKKRAENKQRAIAKRSGGYWSSNKPKSKPKHGRYRR